MIKKNILQLDLSLEENSQSVEKHTILYTEDLNLIESLKLPKIIQFHRADKFDSKFINVNEDIWSYVYSGQRIKLNFAKLNKYEKKLAKYFLVYYIQVNTPSHLDAKLQAYIYLIKILHDNKLKLNYSNFKSILVDLAKNENAQYYYFLKFLAKLLFLENFLYFDIDQEYELEFIERPKSFNSELYYQQYEDRIDYPTTTMIHRGFFELNKIVGTSQQDIDDQTLL